jgi:uncharacterized membrane protein YkvA (DUF1232 family)
MMPKSGDCERSVLNSWFARLMLPLLLILLVEKGAVAAGVGSGSLCVSRPPAQGSRVEAGHVGSALPALSGISALHAQPLERRVGVGARRLLRTIGIRMRRMYRILVWVVGRWANWTVEAVLFTALAMVAPALHRGLIRTWRLQGLGALLRAVGVAVLVYARLLFDRRSPAVGKLLLLFAVAYGVAPADLIPDLLPPLGLADDLILLTLASRSFVKMCDDELVYEHAVHVARTFATR